MAYKTFKEYYQDPEFRSKHKKYMLTRVSCECGAQTARCNMSKHKKTAKHQKWEESRTKSKVKKDLYQEKLKQIKKLEKIFSSLQEAINNF